MSTMKWGNAAVLLAGFSVALAGCPGCPGGVLGGASGSGSSGNNTTGGDGGGNATGDGGTSSGDGGGPCRGLQCQQVTCSGGGTTSISGVVNIPAGNLPLPNAVVYVPNGPLAPIVQGASCDRCDATLSGDPLVQTTTNIRGEFTLENMPVGQDIPVVIQVGKWRRQITVPAIDPCADHPIAATTTRLPRNQTEGDIPRIALTTGGADALECLLRKLGLDDSEFTPETGAGRVNFYVGRQGSDRYRASLNGGATFTNARTWWNDVNNLTAYDIVIHSCEGTTDSGNKSTQARQALQTFADLGGRVFLSHWHNIWLEGGTTAFQSVATWDHQGNPPNPTTGYIDTSFAKGASLAQWMLEVQGSTTMGELEIRTGRRTLDAVNADLAQRWIWIQPGGTQSVQYMSFNTPVGAADDQQCGRVVFSDIHVSSGDSSQGESFPDGCTSQGLSPQEKALVFMLFDLSSCIVPDNPCIPTTCQAEGAQCGTIDNGCGVELACPQCSAPLLCENNLCVSVGG